MNIVSIQKITGYTLALSGGFASVAMGQAADLTFEVGGVPQTPPLDFLLGQGPVLPLFNTNYSILFGSTQVSELILSPGRTTINGPSGPTSFSTQVATFSFSGTLFPDLTYAGGLLPLDAVVTAADVLAPASFNQVRLHPFATSLSPLNGIGENAPFTLRGLLPFARVSDDFLGFVDITLIGNAFDSSTDGSGTTIGVGLESLIVHGGRGIAGTGNDLNTLSLAGPDAAAVIPVPAALPLLAGGVGALAALRRRRRRKAA